MLDTSIQVKTDYFDGPLGLLLLLVQKEEMDIRQFDLTKITQQYLGYLAQMKDLNFDVAGDYLYLAATLLLLKSKSAITDEEASRLREGIEGGELHITSEAELIRRLEELKHFQKMGEVLWALPKKGHDIFVKPKINRKAIVDSILIPMEVEKLTSAMMDFIVKEKRKYTVVRRDRLSIKEKLSFLKSFLKEGVKTDLDHLVEQDGGKEIDNIVITFISLLELARLKMLTVFQNEDKGTVYVQVTKSLSDFDLESANGFEEEEGNNTPSEIELQEELEKEIKKERDDELSEVIVAAEQESPEVTVH